MSKQRNVKSSECGRRLRWALVSSVVLISALLLRTFLRELPESSPWRDAYLLTRRALLQLGTLGVLLALASYGSALTRRWFGWPSVLSRKTLLGLCASAVIAVISGEVALRIWFWEGVSFAHHYGPIVRHFERNIVLNRYDGPSRGPEMDESQSGAWRLLIQGDSITWGQGVRDERDLYSTLLLEDLRSIGASVEMAVLATPGREMDGHVEQLRRYGRELSPDLLIYQWYSNDLEVDRTKPAPGFRPPAWRRFILYPVLATHSYFWFFIDNRANAILFGREQSRAYTNYLLSRYAAGTPGWTAFESAFAEWAAQAQALTPRTLVVLYSHFGAPGASDAPLRRQVADLVLEHGFEVLDLQGALAAATDDSQELLASPFDSHPGAKGHAVIAAAISEKIVDLWPELRKPLGAMTSRREASGR